MATSSILPEAPYTQIVKEIALFEWMCLYPEAMDG